VLHVLTGWQIKSLEKQLVKVSDEKSKEDSFKHRYKDENSILIKRWVAAGYPYHGAHMWLLFAIYIHNFMTWETCAWFLGSNITVSHLLFLQLLY